MTTGIPAASIATRVLERGWLPDPVIRLGIRRLIASRAAAEREPDAARTRAKLDRFVAVRRTGPIAIDTRAANDQHYEVPTAFYAHVLGRHMKYSSAFWDPGVASLDDAEARMLAITTERAAIADGQRILELGCGWGSLSLWIAERFPNARIVAVSNSRTQKQWIDAQCRERGLANLEVVTVDMNVFEAPGTFDRVVSVEMFEHMRNWQALLANIARWLRDDGRMFLHIFTHREFAYPYEVHDASDWMAKYFFSGGIMPSDRLLYELDDDMRVAEHWHVSGAHYQKTAEAWLRNMDAHRAAVRPILAGAYGADSVTCWWVRWRVFFMACAELWGWHGGDDWLVSHYALVKKR